MQLVSSQSVSGVPSQRVISLPINGVPNDARISGWYISYSVTNATRGGGATDISPSALQQQIVLVNFTPGNSKFSVQCSGHRLGLNRYLCTSQRPGVALNSASTAYKFSQWIPGAPLDGVSGLNHAMRASGAEVNGSQMQLTINPLAADMGSQFTTADYEIKVYCQWRMSADVGAEVSNRLAILDSSNFSGSVLSLQDGLCSLLAVESRDYTSYSCTAGAYQVASSVSPFASDFGSQRFQLASAAGGNLDMIDTVDSVAGSASDPYLANYPKLAAGVLSDTYSVSRIYDLRNHQDAPEGPVVTTFTGRPAGDIGYLVHYIR